jgi:DNA-directed RNA polymerase subunit RPC12/RpoP
VNRHHLFGKRKENKDNTEKKRGGTMLDLPCPTPTCTRFQTSTEMSCIRCSQQMKLMLIEPRDGELSLLTYRCMGCSADESFLKAI